MAASHVGENNMAASHVGENSMVASHVGEDNMVAKTIYIDTSMNGHHAYNSLHATKYEDNLN